MTEVHFAKPLRGKQSPWCGILLKRTPSQMPEEVLKRLWIKARCRYSRSQQLELVTQHKPMPQLKVSRAEKWFPQTRPITTISVMPTFRTSFMCGSDQHFARFFIAIWRRLQ